MRARGNISSIGERDNVQVVVNGSDVWNGTVTSITYPPSSGEQMEIFCANSADTSDGIGVQEVMVHYLDSNGDEQTESKATNGGAIDTTASDMRFIQNIHATKVGSNGVSVGNIDIRSKATPANIFNNIGAGGNMSLNITKMVPRNKTLYLTQWHGSASGKQSVKMRLRSTDIHGDIFGDSSSPVFLFKDTITLENSSFNRNWIEEELFPIPEFSIVKVSVWAPDQAGADVACGWSGILISNT